MDSVNLITARKHDRYQPSMLGEQIYEAKGQITGTRVLDAEQFKMESSYMREGKIREIEVMQIGTFWSVPGLAELYVEKIRQLS